MLLYKTTARRADGTLACVWSGTQAAARADRKAFAGDKLTAIKTADIDVPVSKPKLLEWLNDNYVDLGMEDEEDDAPAVPQGRQAKAAKVPSEEWVQRWWDNAYARLAESREKERLKQEAKEAAAAKKAATTK